MTDTLWSDISEFQVPVTDAYPYACLCIRSNDGTHLDTKFTGNLAWCKTARASGKLFAFGVYYFYRPGTNGAAILMGRVGKPDPRMWVMIDVESAGGEVHGNQSAQANAEHDQLAKWLGDPRRVVGYGNTSDLNALWPSKPHGMRVVVAAYGSNPPYPGKFAHQFTDKAATAPFGPSDLNSADGMSSHDLLAMWGMTVAHPPGGPYKHTTKAGDTVHDIVVSRRMLVEDWFALQRKSGANVAQLSSGPLPAGLTWYSVNP